MFVKVDHTLRGGNRGGRDQFDWDKIRLLPYKERECYLGYTSQIGFLDKGGKWRKKDWWTKENDLENEDKIRQEEIKRIQSEDEMRIKAALGMAPEKSKKKPVLTDYEMKELTKREEIPDYFVDSDEEKREVQTNFHGLGYKSDALKVQMNKGLQYGKTSASDLEALTKLKEEGIASKKIKKEKKKKSKKDKKHRKEKKEKKSKKEKKHRKDK